MPLSSLKDLFVHQLRECYAAENLLLIALPRFSGAIKNPESRAAFEDHAASTKKHIARLNRIFECLRADTGKETCHGMTGLVKEGERIIAEEAGDAIQDAALMAIAQRIAHYKISAYSSLRTFAEHLGDEDFAWSLTETLEDAREADQLFAELVDATIHLETAGAADVR